MVAIGRALVARPIVLLLDEPSMGLAPVMVETIYTSSPTPGVAGGCRGRARRAEPRRARRLRPCGGALRRAARFRGSELRTRRLDDRRAYLGNAAPVAPARTMPATEFTNRKEADDHRPDTEFHPRDPEDRTWTETMFLPFNMPEEGIFGNVYVLARPNVGIATSSILSGRDSAPSRTKSTSPTPRCTCPARTRSRSSASPTVSTSAHHRASRPQLSEYPGRMLVRPVVPGTHEPFDPGDPDQNPLLEADRARADPATATNGRMAISRSRATSPVSSSCAAAGIGSTATTEWTTAGGRGSRPAPGRSPGCR